MIYNKPLSIPPGCLRLTHGTRTNLVRLPFVVILAIVLGGCHSKTGPILAGGKPVNEWVRALSDPDAELRLRAAEKLGNVGASDPAVVPALCTALHDADADVRCEVILALAKAGPGAAEAIEPLRAIGRQDSDPRVRSYAARALERLEK